MEVNFLGSPLRTVLDTLLAWLTGQTRNFVTIVFCFNENSLCYSLRLHGAVAWLVVFPSLLLPVRSPSISKKGWFMYASVHVEVRYFKFSHKEISDYNFTSVREIGQKCAREPRRRKHLG